MLKELLKRARRGEDVLDEVLKLVLPKQVDEVKRAVKADIPILIYDNVGGGLDALLFHALKNAGASLVPSYHLLCDNGKMKCNCAYFTVFLNETPKEDLQYI